MPNCFSMGQAAGTAAALALRKGTGSRGISVPELQQLLLEQDVWLGEDFVPAAQVSGAKEGTPE
jgi:hypothetical protein